MMHAPFSRAMLPHADADHLFQALLQFAGTPWTFAEGSTLRFTEVPSAGAGDVLRVVTGAARPLYIRWIDFPTQAVTGVALEAESCTALPAPLRLALYRGMLVHLFSLPSGAGLLSGGTDPEAATLADAPPDDLHWLDVSLTVDGIGAFRFRLGGSAADLVAEFRPPVDPDPERSLARQVSMPFDIRIANVVLPQSDLMRLDPGDLLVLPSDMPAPALVGFGQIAELERADDGLSRLRAGAPQSPEEAERAVPVGFARLDIICGSHQASLAEVESWGEASPVVLAYPVPEEGQVAHLFHKCVLLGHGEFLRLDARMALRISSLAATNEKTGMEEP